MKELHMSHLFNRGILTAVFTLFALGTASMAHADVLFHNITDQPIVFSMSCNGNGFDEYTVAPGGDQQLYCTNGSPSAQVKIITNDGDHDEVVHAIVWNGQRYELGYDEDGDVNIWS